MPGGRRSKAAVGLIDKINSLIFTDRLADADSLLTKTLDEARSSAIEMERQRCIEDICDHCAGFTPPYERGPVGPNQAGNWAHMAKDGYKGRPTICKATGIRSRARGQDIHEAIESSQPKDGRIEEPFL